MANKLSGLREYIYSSPFLLNIQKTTDNFLSAAYYITGINDDIIMNFEEDPNKYVSSEFIINKINVEKKFNKELYKSYYLISTSLNTTLLDNTLQDRDKDGNLYNVGLDALVITEKEYQEVLNGTSTLSEDEISDNTSTIPHLFQNKDEFYIYLIKAYTDLNGINSLILELFENSIIKFVNLQNNFLSGNGTSINQDAITYACSIFNYEEEEGIVKKNLSNEATKFFEDTSSVTDVTLIESYLKELNSLMNTQLFYERYFYGENDDSNFIKLYEDEIDFSSNINYPIFNYIIEWSHDYRETDQNGYVFAKNLDKSFINYIPAITFKAVVTTSVDGSDSARRIKGFIDLDLVSYDNSDQIFNFQGCIETLESFDKQGNLEFSYGIHRIKQPYLDSGIESDTLIASTDNYYSYYNNKNDMKVVKNSSSGVEKWSFDISLPEDGLYFTLGLFLDNDLAYNKQIMEMTSYSEIFTKNESNVTIYDRVYTINPDETNQSITAVDRRNNLFNYYSWYKNYSAFDCGFDLVNEPNIKLEDMYGYISNNKINYLGTTLEEGSTDDMIMVNPSFYCLTNTYQTSTEVRLFRSLNELLHSNVTIRNNYTPNKYEASSVTEAEYNAYVEFLDKYNPKSSDKKIEARSRMIIDLINLEIKETDEIIYLDTTQTAILTNENNEEYEGFTPLSLELSKDTADIYQRAALADQNYIIVESVPVVGSEFYNKSDTNQNYIESILYDHYSSIKDNLDAIEGNFDVDMKFYNSYGPAKLLQTNKNNKIYNINKTNIALSFSIKLENGTTLDEASFKNDIVEYVNNCNSVREVSFYIYQLISSLQKSYTNIVYVQYNGMINLIEREDISEDSTKVTYPNYQLITYSSNDITTEQDIIPEYLTIDRKTNENNPTELVPNIIINYL